MTSLSSHILDTVSGKPAANIEVTLYTYPEGDCLATGNTDQDGRVRFSDTSLECRSYTLKFATQAYCQKQFGQAFFPVVEVHFTIDDPDRHYHIPLLLSPYSYSTYRGS